MKVYLTEIARGRIFYIEAVVAGKIPAVVSIGRSGWPPVSKLLLVQIGRLAF
ncbi:MAG: hypothetical protein LKE40_05370 [Spirochaetia bacterium]|nr:hypothetical protein [Spirochaetia bacterium]